MAVVIEPNHTEPGSWKGHGKDSDLCSSHHLPTATAVNMHIKPRPTVMAWHELVSGTPKSSPGQWAWPMLPRESHKEYYFLSFGHLPGRRLLFLWRQSLLCVFTVKSQLFLFLWKIGFLMNYPLYLENSCLGPFGML